MDTTIMAMEQLQQSITPPIDCRAREAIMRQDPEPSRLRKLAGRLNLQGSRRNGQSGRMDIPDYISPLAAAIPWDFASISRPTYTYQG